MRPPISVKQGMEKLASHSGLIHIGTLLDYMQKRERLQNLSGVHCNDPRFSLANILFSMVGLIGIGKLDHDAIEIFRSKPVFFTKACGLAKQVSVSRVKIYPFLSFLRLLSAAQKKANS